MVDAEPLIRSAGSSEAFPGGSPQTLLGFSRNPEENDSGDSVLVFDMPRVQQLRTYFRKAEVALGRERLFTLSSR
jgi:hypothetical protein